MNNNLTEYFKNTVSGFPNKVAIDDNQATMSFSELNKISDQIALEIVSKTKDSRQPIAVYLPKNRWSVASFIGIFKSGNFYIPLDIKSPGERILKIIETLNSSWIITNYEHKENLINLGYQGNIICIEDVVSNPISEDAITKLEQISNSIIDLDPIYSIFTSGSTGDPKGVLISHRGVIDFIEWGISTYDITDKAIIGNQVPLYFDMSVLDIYLMVFTGATLHIIPEEHFAFPIKLIEYVNEKNINLIFWVPSVLNNVSNFDAFSVIKPTSLTKILFGGEAMPNKHLNYWRNNYPNALYSNLYGPTEITVIATYYIVNRTFKDDESLPIGKACKNTQTLIFAEDGKPVKKGEMGELHVRGSLLAYGYYNNSEKTKEAFVQNPLHNLYPDIVYKTGDLVYENDLNEIIFVGRKDSQIKHMGYRIELGEIETAILGIEEVGNSCVLYDDNQKRIVAFFKSKKTGVEIKKELMLALPKYMIPTKWINIEQFPLNANGKINRLELKNML
ncbi:amino acid adenylation domain-containing protein [Flavobacterium paronense]|uniref:Amino acid adenylation domain-containing protein n=1 Tax=Flavobacterium paronense TaxID=1392775 RepID=A0ABV5GFD7_9FLAO|nr:amino acid adenylation domain-containing protein [Flavobacterium paronense]MDN3676043.1 amino acid adenylation domain-containing protein [Flavobacterium paronense]